MTNYVKIMYVHLKLFSKKFVKNGKQLNVEKGRTSVEQERRPVAVSKSNF